MIKQELLQYTARLIETHPLQENSNKKAARHDVSALLVEHALDLSIEDNKYDLFIAKPILRAALLLVKQRVETIKALKDYNYALSQLEQEYLQTISTLEKILENLK